MGLKFRCKTCGEEVVVRFLKVGEAAECKNCGASNPVPESAESADDETAASYQSRARRSTESDKSLLEAREKLHDVRLWKTLWSISLMGLGLIMGIALPLLMMSPEDRNPNAGHSVPGIMLVIYGGGVLNRLRQKALATQQIPQASRPQDRKMAMEESGFWWGDQRASDDMSFPIKKTKAESLVVLRLLRVVRAVIFFVTHGTPFLVLACVGLWLAYFVDYLVGLIFAFYAFPLLFFMASEGSKIYVWYSSTFIDPWREFLSVALIDLGEGARKESKQAMELLWRSVTWKSVVGFLLLGALFVGAAYALGDWLWTQE